jgi:hypothetical protein
MSVLQKAKFLPKKRMPHQQQRLKHSPPQRRIQALPVSTAATIRTTPEIIANATTTKLITGMHLAESAAIGDKGSTAFFVAALVDGAIRRLCARNAEATALLAALVRRAELASSSSV